MLSKGLQFAVHCRYGGFFISAKCSQTGRQTDKETKRYFLYQGEYCQNKYMYKLCLKMLPNLECKPSNAVQ